MTSAYEPTHLPEPLEFGDWQDRERAEADEADMANDIVPASPFVPMHVAITDELLNALAVAESCMGNAGREHKQEIQSLAISLRCARINAERSGGTDLQDTCMDRQHCLAIADKFAQVGLLQAMADQLATCGGVSVRVVIPPAPTPVAVVRQTGVTAEQLAVEIRRLEQRQDAIARQTLAK